MGQGGVGWIIETGACTWQEVVGAFVGVLVGVFVVGVLVGANDSR